MAGRRDGAEMDATLVLPSVRRAGPLRARWPVLLLPAWAALAVVNIMLFGVGSTTPNAAAARTTTRPHVTTTAPSASAGKPSSAPSPSVQPSFAAETLVPAGIAAYGPTGLGSGDNADQAVNAIDASTATAWQTDWYNSAAFGNLQTGTGLLIDMGRPVTITSAQIILGSTPGADLELLTGNSSARQQMLVQASASDASGGVRLTLAHPQAARYLLIWFTQLPPDAAGTFQATVYDVTLEGTP